MRIAIEAGTHSPWASRVLEECGHEVLVANARKLRLIYANKQKTDEIDALRTSLAWLEWTRSCCTHSSTGRREPGSYGHRPLARGAGGYPHAACKPRSRRGQVLRSSLAQVPGQKLPQESLRAHPRGALAGSWAHLGADRLADQAYPRLRPKAGDDFQGNLPRNGAPAPGGGSRDAYGAYLRAHRGSGSDFTPSSPRREPWEPLRRRRGACSPAPARG
jgi:hypothetical protein